MKNIRIEDCNKTMPPSTVFVWFPETESDLALLAEISDLPTANRCGPKGFPDGATVAQINEARRAGRTVRVGLASLSSHFDLPGATPDYQQALAEKLEAEFGIGMDNILPKAFVLRFFHW